METISKTVVNMKTEKTRNKANKKVNTYNALVLTRLQRKYGYSKTYIRQCIDGTRQAEVADLLKKEYNALNKAVMDVLK